MNLILAIMGLQDYLSKKSSVMITPLIDERGGFFPSFTARTPSFIRTAEGPDFPT